MNLDKDSYEYLTNFADDRTVLSLLSTNKKFNDPKLFERILTKRYPSLLRFKKGENWKLFYLKMIKAISAMKEEFDIDYDIFSYIDPDKFYNYLRILKEAIYQAKNLFLDRTDCHIEINIIDEKTKWTPDVERDRFLHIYFPDEQDDAYVVYKHQEPIQNILLQERFYYFPSIKELYKFIANETIFNIIVRHHGNPYYSFDINQKL